MSYSFEQQLQRNQADDQRALDRLRADIVKVTQRAQRDAKFSRDRGKPETNQDYILDQAERQVRDLEDKASKLERRIEDRNQMIADERRANR